ncbi:MAG: hypothetical protein K1W35_11840 [Lachnospiraceae bacterium]
MKRALPKILLMADTVHRNQPDSGQISSFFKLHFRLYGYPPTRTTINIWKAMLNTYSYVIPKVIFTLGYGELSFALCLNSPLIVNADIQ